MKTQTSLGVVVEFTELDESEPSSALDGEMNWLIKLFKQIFFSWNPYLTPITPYGKATSGLETKLGKRRSLGRRT